MGNDDREICQPIYIPLQHLFETPRISFTLDTIVQLSEQPNRLFRARFSDAIWTIEEEVIASIFWFHSRRIEDYELAYTRENKIFQDGGRSSTSRYDENVRWFEGTLTRCCPKSVGRYESQTGLNQGVQSTLIDGRIFESYDQVLS